MVIATEHHVAFDYLFLGHWTPEPCLQKRTIPLPIVFNHPIADIFVWSSDGEASSSRLPWLPANPG
jgi:hypothetical protein